MLNIINSAVYEGVGRWTKWWSSTAYAKWANHAYSTKVNWQANVTNYTFWDNRCGFANRYIKDYALKL